MLVDCQRWYFLALLFRLTAAVAAASLNCDALLSALQTNGVFLYEHRQVQAYTTAHRSSDSMLLLLATNPPTTLYMGRDKFENEDLLRYGYEEDIWFHVDKFSSAHVYIRMNPGMTIDNLPLELVIDCAQLTKANSIEGNKKLGGVQVVYTLWTNLKKTQGMDVGQVGFHQPSQVKRIHIDKRANETINRLNKTKLEKVINFQEEKILRLRHEKESLRAAEMRKKLLDIQEQEQKKKETELTSYQDVFRSVEMKPNTHNSAMDIEEYENSFM